MADQRYAHFKDFSSSDTPFEERKRIWLEISPNLTAEGFDAMMAANAARQGRVPAVGAPAPDFALERLTSGRQRTGEYVRLSELRGKSVALCFGSYT